MGMNPQKMLMQMQQQMARVQEELETATVDGSAGGGVVKATVDGQAGPRRARRSTRRRSTPRTWRCSRTSSWPPSTRRCGPAQELAEQKMGAVTAGLRIPGLG